MPAAAVHKVDDINCAHIILGRDGFRRKIGIESFFMGISLPEMNDLL